MDVLCWSAPSVAENLALDVELAKSADATGRHLVRFWWGDGPAVVLGSSEQAEEVVDTSACEELGVPVLKRCSGGGTVLQNGGVLNYSLITPAPTHLDVATSFCQGTNLVRAILSKFGVTGVPQGTSDVAVEDRKISGNAQARRWKAVLVHGTLLVDFDFALAERVLLHPPREPEYRQGRSHRDFLVTLRALGLRADRTQIENAAVAAAQELFAPNCVTRRVGQGEFGTTDTPLIAAFSTGESAFQTEA